MNCLSELLEPLGGIVHIDKLPIGDPTLSTKEILCNESQERMGLIIAKADLELLRNIAERERCPMYVVGEITGDHKLRFLRKDDSAAVDLPYDVLFGAAPQTVLTDATLPLRLSDLEFDIQNGEQNALRD